MCGAMLLSSSDWGSCGHEAAKPSCTPGWAAGSPPSRAVPGAAARRGRSAGLAVKLLGGRHQICATGGMGGRGGSWLIGWVDGGTGAAAGGTRERAVAAGGASGGSGGSTRGACAGCGKRSGTSATTPAAAWRGRSGPPCENRLGNRPWEAPQGRAHLAWTADARDKARLEARKRFGALRRRGGFWALAGPLPETCSAHTKVLEATVERPHNLQGAAAHLHAGGGMGGSTATASKGRTAAAAPRCLALTHPCPCRARLSCQAGQKGNLARLAAPSGGSSDAMPAPDGRRRRAQLHALPSLNNQRINLTVISATARVHCRLSTACA